MRFPAMDTDESPLIPQRANLVAECARVIESRIAMGEWQNRLPGERQLAELLHVGRDTVRLALPLLERKGVLSAVSAGSRRKILAVPRIAPSRGLRVGLLAQSRLELLPQPTLLEIDQIRGALAAKGGQLKVHSPGWYGSARPEKLLESFLAAESCQAWILFRSGAVVQRAFAALDVPCLIRGYPHDGVGLPHLDVDWAATARHAASHLWRLGHRRVAIIEPPDPLQGVVAAVRGVLDFQAEGIRPVSLQEGGDPESMARVISRALSGRDAPTAFICTRPRQAATLLTLLGSWGIRVPAKVSIVTLAREPFLDALVPRLASYHMDPAAVARQAIRRLDRLIAGGAGDSSNPWLVPEFDAGASAGPPP